MNSCPWGALIRSCITYKLDSIEISQTQGLVASARADLVDPHKEGFVGHATTCGRFLFLPIDVGRPHAERNQRFDQSEIQKPDFALCLIGRFYANLFHPKRIVFVESMRSTMAQGLWTNQ